MPGPGTSFDSEPDFDPQDLAETFDESMTVGGEGDVSLGGESPVTPGEDMRTFEEMPDVYDVTRRAGDPLISRVAARLTAMAAGDDEAAATARVALRELHAACVAGSRNG